MTSAAILTLVFVPFIAAIGAVIVFQIIDRVVEARRRRASHHDQIAA